MRPKFRHKTDRAQPPLLASAPDRPVTGGYASAGLLVWVATAKDVDPLPFYAAPGITRSNVRRRCSPAGARRSRATVINIKNESYRMKEKRLTGLFPGAVA